MRTFQTLMSSLICDFDPFGDGLYRYTTNTVCRETGNSINDGIVTIYLNAHDKNNTDIPDELLQFLDYVKNTGRKKTLQKETKSSP